MSSGQVRTTPAAGGEAREVVLARAHSRRRRRVVPVRAAVLPALLVALLAGCSDAPSAGPLAAVTVAPPSAGVLPDAPGVLAPPGTGSTGASTGPTPSPTDGTAASAGASATAYAGTGLAPPPWAGPTLKAGQVPGAALAAWRGSTAATRAQCPLLVPDERGRRPAGAAREADFGSTGWGVTWDVPGAPGQLRDGTDHPRAGRSTYGVAGVGDLPEGDEFDWPLELRWSDGSRAGYGIEGSSTLHEPAETPKWLAYLRLAGQPDCLYNVWSNLGREHLEALLGSLRRVDGAQA